MTYRFKIPHRQFRVGDLVPDTYDPGMIATMLQFHRIEPVPEPAPSFPPDNKAIAPDRVKRKAAV